ncbi:MAG TPA: (d)CMP kinase [Burkholderiaceae bacterium]|nr:(d)CMP kinase [Burkholderiaceae bacterium]
MTGVAANSVPVITVDGPTASGKGTVAARVAAALGYHYLDSGALYRLVTLRALEEGIQDADVDGLARLAGGLQPRFHDNRVELDGRDVTQAIRTEDVSRMASRIAVHAPIRAALRHLQLGFRRAPGLVADGRDMGTVVFPSADLKVFLTASLEARAERRYKQLIEKGLAANMPDLLADLRVRDERDSTRAAAPLRPAEDAYRLDSSALSIDEVVAQILAWYRDR